MWTLISLSLSCLLSCDVAECAGLPGVDGLPGHNGTDGIPGQDGLPGADGKRGKRGKRFCTDGCVLTLPVHYFLTSRGSVAHFSAGLLGQCASQRVECNLRFQLFGNRMHTRKCAELHNDLFRMTLHPQMLPLVRQHQQKSLTGLTFSDEIIPLLNFWHRRSYIHFPGGTDRWKGSQSSLRLQRQI